MFGTSDRTYRQFRHIVGKLDFQTRLAEVAGRTVFQYIKRRAHRVDQSTTGAHQIDLPTDLFDTTIKITSLGTTNLPCFFYLGVMLPT